MNSVQRLQRRSAKYENMTQGTTEDVKVNNNTADYRGRTTRHHHRTLEPSAYTKYEGPTFYSTKVMALKVFQMKVKVTRGNILYCRLARKQIQ